MSEITTFLKENYQLVCLLVGFVGVFIAIAILSLIDEIKKKRQNKNKD